MKPEIGSMYGDYRIEWTGGVSGFERISIRCPNCESLVIMNLSELEKFDKKCYFCELKRYFMEVNDYE